MLIQQNGVCFACYFLNNYLVYLVEIDMANCNKSFITIVIVGWPIFKERLIRRFIRDRSFMTWGGSAIEPRELWN